MTCNFSHPRSEELSNQVSRRGLLQLGQLSGLGLVAPALIPQTQGTQVRGARAHAKNCILVWLDGGPSHLETFDVKPNAPGEVRGPLEAISTAVDGIAVSECLPGIASRMNDLAIIRSMTSPLGEHNLGTHYMLSGFQPSAALTYPSFHAVGCLQTSADERLLPNNVAIPDYRVGGGRYRGTGYLPSDLAAFAVGGDPGRPDFAVRNLALTDGLTLDRIERRREFAAQIQQWNRGGLEETAPEFERAFRLVTSPEASEAFDIDAEPPELRKRYGSRSVGQSCLLARRLVERGVNFVTVNNRGWDTHTDLESRLKDGFKGARTPTGLIPSLDRAVSSLLDDLKDRGLLDETLVVVMGEFGRTPKLNTRGGRDHWPRVFSVLLAGGGIQGGQVIGSSDAVGESPRDRPVKPSDLVATIYTLLGIDPQTELTTPDQRPVRLVPSDARVISELAG